MDDRELRVSQIPGELCPEIGLILECFSVFDPQKTEKQGFEGNFWGD